MVMELHLVASGIHWSGSSVPSFDGILRTAERLCRSLRVDRTHAEQYFAAYALPTLLCRAVRASQLVRSMLEANLDELEGVASKQRTIKFP